MMDETHLNRLTVREMPMEKIILIHGSGHKAASWAETVSHLENREGRPVPGALRPACGKCGQLSQSVRRVCGLLRQNRRTSPPVRPLPGRDFGIELRAGFSGQGQDPGADRDAPQSPQGGVRASKIWFSDCCPNPRSHPWPSTSRIPSALGCGSMEDLDFSGRVSGISCPTLLLCGGKGQREPEIRPLPGPEHPGRGIADPLPYGAYCE